MVKKYERKLFHAQHLMRAKRDRFKPLSEEQYNKLCDKIEQQQPVKL